MQLPGKEDGGSPITLDASAGFDWARLFFPRTSKWREIYLRAIGRESALTIEWIAASGVLEAVGRLAARMTMMVRVRGFWASWEK